MTGTTLKRYQDGRRRAKAMAIEGKDCGKQGRYFLLRRGFEAVPAERDARALAGTVFFNHWTRKLNPYSRMQEGDTVYLMDGGRRALAVEMRVSGLMTERYDSLDDGWGLLYRVFGIGEDDNTSVGYAPKDGPGFLLAFSVDIIRPLDIAFPFPWDKLGGRHGYISVDTFAASDAIGASERSAVLDALPEPGQEPIAFAPTFDLGALEGHGEVARAPRDPTTAVKLSVLADSQGRCQHPGCSEPGAHFDHIYPWNKGGNSERQNIQWLCARHNLTKSDKIPDTWDPTQLWVNWEPVDEDVTYDELTIGTNLTALEVRTRHSIYDVVRDADTGLVYVWKRRSRQVMVALDPGDALIEKRPGAKGRTLGLGAVCSESGDMFLSSPVEDEQHGDPVAALARVGAAPGKLIALNL